MGICKLGNSDEIWIITEFLAKGSLFKILHNRDINLAGEIRLKIAQDVARGMNYLHKMEPPIIHRDLKSHNLLVDENYKVKVKFFFLCVLKEYFFFGCYF